MRKKIVIYFQHCKVYNCKIAFQNNNLLKYNDIYELNKSKFFYIKGNVNEKSLLSKINSYSNRYIS